jgi:prevent-host-death family protein
MAYTVHQAKTHFSRLLKEAEAGKEVVVMRGSKPVARIVPIADQPPSKRQLAGIYRGTVTFDDKALDPLSDAELLEFGFVDLLEGELVSQPPAQPSE